MYLYLHPHAAICIVIIYIYIIDIILDVSVVLFKYENTNHFTMKWYQDSRREVGQTPTPSRLKG